MTDGKDAGLAERFIESRTENRRTCEWASMIPERDLTELANSSPHSFDQSTEKDEMNGSTMPVSMFSCVLFY